MIKVRAKFLYSSLIICLSLLALPNAEVQAQTNQDLFALYASSTTPSYYKRAIARILASRSSAPNSPITVQSFGAAGSNLSLSGHMLQVSAADPAFTFHDFYAFPNPSRHGQAVTIRLQVGVADSVDVRIYDVSGQPINHGAPNPPQIIDDGNGNGPQYTYDYSWDTSKAGSGVYLYVITAKKSGQPDIKKIGKAGILK